MLNIWKYISLRRRREFNLLFILTIITSITEAISLGFVKPFIDIITEPNKLFAIPIIMRFIQWLGFKSDKSLVILLTLSFIISVLIAGVLRLLLTWVSIRLGSGISTDLSIDIYRKTLYQPFSVHMNRSSSEVISGVTQKVGETTLSLIALITLLTHLVLFMTIITTLVLMEPIVSIVVAVSFAIAYSLIAWGTYRRLINNGKIIAQQQTHIIKSLQEGLGAVRNVILEGRQEDYANIYRESALKLRGAQVKTMFMSQAPAYGLETLAIVMIGFVVLILSYRTNDIKVVLPILGIIAFGAQRILPIMQQTYKNWSILMKSKAVLIDILSLLDQPLPITQFQPKTISLMLTKEIRFYDVSFQYENNSSWKLNQLNLVIPKGSRVGIVGTSGSGKSTVLDLLMGLIEPTKGGLIIDGLLINASNRRAWQRNIAHVPQMIFLADGTIAENIAFGVPQIQIDYSRVYKAAELACLSRFIENSTDQYNTLVGEHGIRLSGGQRQRIGIARALYQRASVLCFDEATSALDNDTENHVMQAIDNLNNNLTILIIAHRFTTLKNCTHILKIENGNFRFYPNREHGKLLEKII